MATFTSLNADGDRGSVCGPFRSSAGKLYIISKGTDTGSLDRYVYVNWTDSATPDTATWSLISTNAIDAGVGGNVKHIWAAQEGDIIHVLTSYYSTGTDATVYAQFDMSSGTNGAWVDLGGGSYDSIVLSLDNSNRSTELFTLYNVWQETLGPERANGDLLAVYQGASHAVKGTDYSELKGKISTNSGSSWGSEFNIATNSGEVSYMSPSAVLSVNGRWHVAYHDDAGNIYVTSFTTTGSTPNATQTDTGYNCATPASSDHSMIGAGISYTDGGVDKVAFPYYDGTQISILTFTDADSPSGTFASNAVTDEAPASLAAQYCRWSMLVADGTDIYCFYISDVDDDINYDLNDSTDVTEVTATATQVSVGLYSASGTKLGIAWQDSSGWDFDELSLGAGSQTLSPTAFASTKSITAPTLAPGQATLSPTAFASTKSITALSALKSVVTLGISSFSSTKSITNLTLVPGAVGLDVSPFASTKTITAPSLVPGAASISVDAFGSTKAITGPTLVPGASAIIPTSFASTKSITNLTLVPGAATISIDAFSSTKSIINVSISAVGGTQTLEPTAFSSTKTITALASISGIAYLQPNAFASTKAITTPSLAPGIVTLNPDVFSSTKAITSLTLVPGSVTIQPAAFVSTKAITAPAITSGAVILSPAAFLSTKAITAITMLPGGVSIAPDAFPSAKTITSLTMLPGGVNLAPTPFASTKSITNLGLVPGAASLLPVAFSSTKAIIDVVISASGALQTLDPTAFASTKSITALTIRYPASGVQIGDDETTVQLGDIPIAGIQLGDIVIWP